jgi:hypothetical protein
LASVGTSNGRMVSPFATVDTKDSGEKDGCFFFPTEDVQLDPNWMLCYVSNLCIV